MNECRGDGMLRFLLAIAVAMSLVSHAGGDSRVIRHNAVPDEPAYPG